jgi:hypothetical protein
LVLYFTCEEKQFFGEKIMNYNLVEKFESFKKCSDEGCQCSMGIYPCKFLASCLKQLSDDATQAIENGEVDVLKEVKKHLRYMYPYLDQTQQKEFGYDDIVEKIDDYFNPLKICCSKAWSGDCVSSMKGLDCGERKLAKI